MLLRERFFVTIVLGAGLSCLLTWLLPAPTNLLFAKETQSYRFYLQKTHLRTDPDLIVIGDSRTLRGVSPSAMAERLPQLRIFNFAYNAGGLNREMYADAEDRLNPDGRIRAVLIGITPLALYDAKSRNTQYREFLDKSADDVYLKLHFPAAVDFLQPRRPSDLVSAVLDIEPHTYYEQEFHADGWIGSDRRPPAPREAFVLYRSELAGRSMSRELIADLIAQTGEWTSRGIRVFACRPPTSLEMEALEDSLTGFDERGLAESFRAAGGIWLPAAKDKYGTYDGSHLRREEAQEFSRDLATLLAPYLLTDRNGVSR
ncbi:MAG: hypothetical protein Q7W29_06775 [bacterium]|nr:hypothetical protein [bacterium]